MENKVCYGKTLVFGGEPHSNLTADIGMTALRIFMGLSMAFAHGINKMPPPENFVGMVGGLGFPMPVVFAWAAAISEFIGAILLALGLLTRPAALFLMITMLVAALGAHWSDPYSSKELPLLFAFVSFQFMLAGSGRFGLDRFLR